MQVYAVKTDFGMTRNLTSILRVKETTNLHRKSGEYGLSSDRIVGIKLLCLSKRPVDGYCFLPRIDEPDERDAIFQVLTDFPAKFLETVGR